MGREPGQRTIRFAIEFDGEVREVTIPYEDPFLSPAPHVPDMVKKIRKGLRPVVAVPDKLGRNR